MIHRVQVSIHLNPSANDMQTFMMPMSFSYLGIMGGKFDPSLQKSKVKVLKHQKWLWRAWIEDMKVGDGLMRRPCMIPTWLDPEKVAEEAQIIAGKLSELDSANKDTYQKRTKF